MVTRVLLVDDHAMFRGGLRLLLEREPDLNVVGEADNGQAALDLVLELMPDVIMMDISMPDMDGIEATQRILAEAPEIKIIALSIHSDKGYVQRMLHTGVAGYILKESAPEEVVEGIRAVRVGEVYLSATITDIVVSGYKEILSGEGVIEESSEISSLPLLSTKLLRPPISQRVIPRKRLVDQLEAGRWRPLTLVCAPAGYGKSILVCQWLETIESDCPGVWLSLDEGDNNLRTFLTYLAASVQTKFPEALQKTLQMLKRSALPSLNALVSSLINELDCIPQRFIMVLDDYYYIVDPPIHEFLAEFLRHPPKNTHLVLVTRADPPLDLLSLLAYRQMGEVRARAMSFSTDETAAFLQNVSGSEVDEETVNALKERTDGWVMGLRLVTLSVNNIAELKSRATVLPGEQRTLDYLATEALSRQPRDIQTWLLETSILDRFCAPLCEAVCLPAETGESSNLNGDGFIQWLMESNLFVIPLDQRREWFRYHHLFGELLQNQLKNVLDAEEIYRLYSRASQWFLENGHVAEAIDYALAANDVMGAAQIVERNRYAIQDKDEWFTLEKWLSKLPEGVKQTRPGLLIAQAKVSLVHQDFPGVLASIEEAERIMGADQSNQTEDDPLWGEIYHLKGYFTYFQGLGSIANQHQRRALELLPESNQLDMAEAKLHFGLSLQMCGEKVNAIDDFNQQLRAGGHLSPIQRTRLWSGLAFIHLLEGDLPEVLYPAQQCQAITANQKDVYAEAYMQYLDTCVHFMQNNQDKASRNLSWIEDQRFIIQKRVAIDGFCESALIHQVQGQADKVAAATSRLLEFAAETQDPANLLIASSCQARLSLMQADTASALEWLGKTDLNYDAGIMLWWIEIPRLTACRVLIAEGSQRSLEQATEKLLQYKIENQAVHNTYQVIVILPLIALAYHKLSNDDEALKVLKEALELGRPGGWIWPFIEGGASMAGLLKRLRRGSVATELGYYIDRILAVFSTPKEKVDPFDQTGLVKPLTERELQVLQLLTSTLSATEIAAELVVSVNTVRMHTKNIYRKLVVNSRIEAVERAREMGLI